MVDTYLIDLVKKSDEDIREPVAGLSDVVASNCQRVLDAFTALQVSETDFFAGTGYSYNDTGRDKLDQLFAKVFGSESALVRTQIVSGTHALTLAFFSLLRPGDQLVSLTGAPYDTLKKVISGSGRFNGSLHDFGIRYREADITNNGEIAHDALEAILQSRPKAVFMQRSRGYAWRSSLNVSQIKEIIEVCKTISPDTYCIVDNCYGEFTENYEPTHVGADLVAGSLIKNPGGSLAPSGGYLAGRRELIEAAGFRLTAPGIGSEVGGHINGARLYMQGLFYAPFIVGEALVSAIFSARLFSLLGFPVSPGTNDHRSDIIQAIRLGSQERVIAFCQGIQKGSPIDSHVSPIPWDMPGYEHPVIMAAGTFIQGASIELSADAPIREPFDVFLQGGVSRHYSKIAILRAINEMKERGLLPQSLSIT